MNVESTSSGSEAEAAGYSASDADDSDRELQVAFERGLLKPGLNAVKEAKRPAINNTAGLESALTRLSNGQPWLERLDVSTQRTPSATAAVATPQDTENDFEREVSFYTQAQSSVAEAFSRLKSMDIATSRPEDYYAQMAKSDKHMQKVRAHLLTVQKDKERRTAVKQLREQRKYGAQVQKKVAVERQSEKKQLAAAVKAHRKGMKEQLEEMLGDAHAAREAHKDSKQKEQQKKQRNLSKKRVFKNEKYGFGGRKKGSKRNTKESANDMTAFSHKAGAKLNKKGGMLKGPPKKHLKKRPGKSARARSSRK